MFSSPQRPKEGTVNSKFLQIIAWSFLFFMGSAHAQGFLNVSPREQVVTITTQSKTPHLVGLWQLAGMFSHPEANVQSITLTRTGPWDCVPHTDIRVSIDGSQFIGVRSFNSGNEVQIFFQVPIKVPRGELVEVGVYTTSNNLCPYSFALELTSADARSQKGGTVPTLISLGFGGIITPSN